MIARVWSPLQRRLAARPAVAGLGGAACAAALGVAASVHPAVALAAATVALVAIVSVAVSGDDRQSAVSAATAFAWGSALTVSAGLAPRHALVVVAVAVWFSCFGGVFARGRERTGAVARHPAGAPLAVGLALVASAGASTFAPPAAPLSAWFVVWALVWTSLTQRPLVALAGLVAPVVALVGLPTPIPPIALTLALLAPVAVWHDAHHARTPSGPLLLVLAAAAFTCTVLLGGAWTLGRPLPVFAFAPAIGTLAGALVAVALSRPGAGSAKRSNASPVQRVHRAAHGLAPYFRWFTVAKLASDPLYRTAADTPRPWGRVLDVGAGTGIASAVAAARAGTESVTAVDLDHEKLRAACALVERMNPDARFTALAGYFPDVLTRTPHAVAPNAAFDTVLLFDMLHYTDPQTQRSILAAARDHLAPDGRLLIREAVAAPNGDAGTVAKNEAWATRFALNPPGDMHFFTADEWTTLLADLHLTCVHREPCGKENVWMECVLQAADTTTESDKV